MVELGTGLNEKTIFPFSVDQYEEDSPCCFPLCVTSSGSTGIPQGFVISEQVLCPETWPSHVRNQTT